MGDYNDEVGSALPKGASDAVHDWRRVVEAKANHVGRARSGRRRDSREPDDSDLGAPASDDGVVSDPFHVTAVGVADIGAEESKFRLAHAGAESVDAPIEFVIAEGGRSIAHSIVVVDYGPAERQV